MDLKAEQRRIVTRSMAAIVFCGLVLGASYWLLPRFIDFPVEPVERLFFVMRADLFVAGWILIAVQRVSSGRFRSAADNRGSAYSSPSPAIAVKVAFLQNTLEQAFAAVVVHLALATMIGGNQLALIVGAVFLFAVGRMAFLVGYPHGAGARAFGMATTMIPTVAAFLWAIALIAHEAIT